MQKIVTNLWFDKEAEEAAKFYTSLFKDSKITYTSYYGKSGAEISGKKEGEVMTVDFTLNGQEFTALNGGPIFKFTEAISLLINCDTQEEIDTLHAKLSEGGEIQPCGWVKDKYGLSWQIVPTVLGKLMTSGEPAKTEATMAAMLQMKKLDVAKLQAAYDNA